MILIYFKEWLKSFELSFVIEWLKIKISLLYLHLVIQQKIEQRAASFHLALVLPKYSLVFTDSRQFFYLNKKYYFYRKKIIKDFDFYILHAIGDNVEQIEGNEDKWE